MIVVIINHKGGVGKTTTTVNLAAALAEAGKRVLLVDWDSQGNATKHLGHVVTDPRNTIDGCLQGQAVGNPIVKISERLSLLPSTRELQFAPERLGGRPSGASLLRRLLKPLEADYDLILVDCPPIIPFFGYNALTAADYALVPMSTQFFGAYSPEGVLEAIREIRETTNPNLQLAGVVATMFNRRRRGDKAALAAIRREFGDRAFKTVIRSNARVAESPGAGQTVLAYDSGGYGAEDYRALAAEVLPVFQ
jgi:chromosome partitioning protein